MAKIKTSQKILNCATRLFAQHGYDGTIMDSLAEQCGVNKASIYYHHKDKATLYENTLSALFTPVADFVIKAVESESDPIKKLDAHIKAFAIANAQRPYFSAILMREMASGGANMPVGASEQMQRILFMLSHILRSGESQNLFKWADPLIIHFMIVGTINLYVVSIPFRNTLPETDECNQLRNSNIESASDQLSETIIASLLIK
ncbi:MAG: TetR/AcrR family transcriptional regulator [Sinobacterium sp.]|nr:TetR/AcrR family transcriptional regulator [Sinobacterium sp.]